jgi:hypothetical protein
MDTLQMVPPQGWTGISQTREVFIPLPLTAPVILHAVQVWGRLGVLYPLLTSRPGTGKGLLSKVELHGEFFTKWNLQNGYLSQRGSAWFIQIGFIDPEENCHGTQWGIFAKTKGLQKQQQIEWVGHAGKEHGFHVRHSSTALCFKRALGSPAKQILGNETTPSPAPILLRYKRQIII